MARGKTYRRNTGTNIEFYARPYRGGGGFYFSAPGEFEDGMEKLGVEEVEIEVAQTKGSPGPAQLAETLLSFGVLDQNNIDAWWEEGIEDLGEEQQAAMFHIVTSGISRDLDSVLQHVEDMPSVYEEEAGGAVEQYVVDVYGEDNVTAAIPADELSGYIDWDRVAVAWGTEGRVDEVDFGGKRYTFVGGFR